MNQAVKLLLAVLIGGTAGWLTSLALNALYAALTALLGTALGTVVYLAVSVTLGFFGAKFLLSQYFALRPAARKMPAFARFAR